MQPPQWACGIPPLAVAGACGSGFLLPPSCLCLKALPSPPPLAACSEDDSGRTRVGLAHRRVLARQLRLCIAAKQDCLDDGGALLALLRQPIDQPGVKQE